MGSSVAWKLAEQGAKVVIVEQQGEKYEQGSSFGTARISRSLGPKKDVFSFVHNRTVKEVKKLIGFLNEGKSSEKHRMEDVYSTSPVSYIYSKDQYSEIDKLRYKKQRNDYRRGSGDSAFRKFGVTLKSDQVMVREYREYSGTINPKELIRKLRLGIEQKGGKIKYNTQVSKLTKKDGFFELEIRNLKTQKTKTIRAEKVVVAAGPYTVSVFKDFAPYFNRVITPKRVLISYFKISDKRYQSFSEKEIKSILKAQPVFSQLGKQYFSMIEKMDKKGRPIFKVGGHKIHRNIIDLDQVWNLEVHRRELKWAKKQFRKYFEMLEIFLDKKEIELVEVRNCVYSMTRNQIPLVSHVYNKYGSLDKNIVVIGGMSGTGAKGCLGYGLMGANLILGKKGESGKAYRKAEKAFSNAGVRLHTKRPRRGRLF